MQEIWKWIREIIIIKGLKNKDFQRAQYSYILLLKPVDILPSKILLCGFKKMFALSHLRLFLPPLNYH